MHVVSTPTAKAVDFFVPGILALAVMSTAMVSLGIATGFERGYGVLKRLGSTPLGRPRLLGAKIATIAAGRDRAGGRPGPGGLRPRLEPRRPRRRRGGAGARSAWSCWPLSASPASGSSWPACLKAEVNLAAANGLYLVLLLLGGMVVPLAKLPGGRGRVAKLLPADALAAGLHAALGTGAAVPGAVLGGARRRGRWRAPAGRCAQLPLGMSFSSSAVNPAA